MSGGSLSRSWFLRYAMLHTRMVVIPVALLAVALISCVVAVAPVPGAENVRLTRNASEVSTCSAVGNIRVNESGSNARTEFRNMVVGFGGNIGVVTNGPTTLLRSPSTSLSGPWETATCHSPSVTLLATIVPNGKCSGTAITRFTVAAAPPHSTLPSLS